MKIYVASSWRNPWQPPVVALLRERGHKVYNFRNPIPGDDGFSWSEIDDDWKEWTPEQYRKRLEHPAAERGFGFDMDALRSCDACVLVQPCGISAHLELGWAVGAGKSTAVLFPLDIQPVPIKGHSVSTAPCSGCGDLDGCHLPGRLRKVEPELMAKMADTILVSRAELVLWMLLVSP